MGGERTLQPLSQKVFLIREAGGKVLEGGDLDQPSGGGLLDSSCLESSKLHVCECVLIMR